MCDFTTLDPTCVTAPLVWLKPMTHGPTLYDHTCMTYKV